MTYSVYFEDGGGSDGDKVDIVCKVGARLVNVFATALCLPSVINIIVITCRLLLLKADNLLCRRIISAERYINSELTLYYYSAK